MRKIRWRAVACELGLTVLCSACGGGGGGPVPPPPPNPLYVRMTGSDTNTGADPAHALRTVSKAAQRALSNYKIIVGPGTYVEGVTTTATGVAPQALQFIADVSGQQTGDPANPVVIDAHNSAANAGFKLSATPGTVIDGFTITGGTDAGIVIKRGNIGSDDFVIQNCIVHNNPGDGIRIQDSASALVFNNLVYSNGGVGIRIAGEVTGSPHARVYSNTMVNNGDHGVQVGTTNFASPHASVHNNIIQGNDARQPPENIKVFTSPPSDIGWDGNFNLVFPGNTYNPSNLRGLKDANSDALFKDGANKDFHLTLGSVAAIDKGGALIVDDSKINILHARTTTGVGLDGGVLDMGFHFLRTP